MSLFNFQIKIQGSLLNGNIKYGNKEVHITNKLKHAVIAEYGSGIYCDFPNSSKGEIKSPSGKMLIIPVVQKYFRRITPEIIAEAKDNAIKYPALVSRLKGTMPNVVGFIFRKSIKGMKPIRMVRGSLNTIKAYLRNDFSNLLSAGSASNMDAIITTALNRSAVRWLQIIVKRTPVLTSNLRTGWNITKWAR